MEYAFVGRREDMWTPDQRPPDQRVYDRSKSTLSWGIRPDKVASKEDADRLRASVRGGTELVEEPESEKDWDSGYEGSSETELENANAGAFISQPLYESNFSNFSDNESGEDGEMMNESFGNRLDVLADWSEVPTSPVDRTLNGRELAEMCFDKYGKYHDIGLVRSKVRLPGNTVLLLAINFYVQELGGFGFRMTEEQYLAKLDTISNTLNAIDQAW